MRCRAFAGRARSNPDRNRDQGLPGPRLRLRLDHHKSQGATVDRSYVLTAPTTSIDTRATSPCPGTGRPQRSLCRRRICGAGRAGGGVDPAGSEAQSALPLARARPKELAHDYLDPTRGRKRTRLPWERAPRAEHAEKPLDNLAASDSGAGARGVGCDAREGGARFSRGGSAARARALARYRQGRGAPIRGRGLGKEK